MNEIKELEELEKELANTNFDELEHELEENLEDLEKMLEEMPTGVGGMEMKYLLCFMNGSKTHPMIEIKWFNTLQEAKNHVETELKEARKYNFIDRTEIKINGKFTMNLMPTDTKGEAVRELYENHDSEAVNYHVIENNGKDKIEYVYTIHKVE